MKSSAVVNGCMRNLRQIQYRLFASWNHAIAGSCKAAYPIVNVWEMSCGIKVNKTIRAESWTQGHSQQSCFREIGRKCFDVDEKIRQKHSAFYNRYHSVLN